LQAKLPDVNAALVYWRSKAGKHAEGQNYDMAIISVNAINALLPAGSEPDGSDNFKVEINSAKYYDLTRDRKTITCPDCKNDCILSDVQQFDVEMDWKESIISGKKSKRVWNCTACGVSNDMNFENIKIEKFRAPYFFRCMPSHPIRKRGLQGRNTFERDFNIWFDIAISELEAQIGRYRAEYIAQNPEASEMEFERFID
jgi:hypothetical protein